MAEVNKEWRLVPVVPTDDMIVAFAEGWYSKKQAIDDPDMLDAYAAMLAVAPDAPEDAQSARIAELERECERLRKEVDTRIDQGRNSHEMLNNVLRENAELREAHDKEWRRSETNAQNVIAMAAELEACRKDAERWRYFRDRLGEPGDEVHVMFGEWCWADGSIEDVEAAIDAAMQEGGV